MNSQKKSNIELAIIRRTIAVRKEKGLSQNNVAKMLDLTRGFIGQVESINSSSVYSLDHLNRLALKLNCSLHDFVPKDPIIDSDSAG